MASMHWQQLTAQRLSPFALDIIMRSFITGTERSFGRPYTYYKKIGIRGYITKEFHGEYLTYLKKKPLSFFRKAFSAFYRECEETLQWFEQLAQQDWKELDEQQARTMIQEIDKHLLHIGGALIAPVLLDGLFTGLLEMLVSRLPSDQHEFCRQALSTTFRTTQTGEMEHELLGLCLKKPTLQEIRTFAEAWGWLGMKLFAGTLFTAKDIQARIVPPGIAKEKLKAMEHAAANRKTEHEKALRILQPSEGEKEIIALLQENVYFRTYRLDVTAKIGFYLLPFFQALAALRDITVDEVYYHTVQELRQGTLPEQELAARRQGFGMIMENGKVTMVTGKAQEASVKIEEHGTAQELRGMCANKGFAKGPVCIVFENKDLVKVREGDILVAEMTYPDYNLAMARAAAIVTDIGGITCHAAIIARELHKPCIIGTGKATKVFRDGDVVEVDAGKGIIKKL